MTVSTPLSGVNQPFKGILLIVVATFLFSSHDALSKYLSGFYPIIMVVWARYVVHTLLMAGIFLPQSGLSVLRTKRPLLQLMRALCLLGTSLFFTRACCSFRWPRRRRSTSWHRCWSPRCRCRCSVNASLAANGSR